MSRFDRFFLVLAGVVALTGGGWNPAFAQAGTLLEDFTSWQFRDPGLTTCDWDTVAGRLQLFPVGLDSLGRIAVPGSAYATAVSGTHLFAALDSPDALACYGIEDPSAAYHLDTFSTLDGARDVLIRDGYAYVAVGMQGLQTVNVGDPADLLGAGNLGLNGFTNALALNGTRLYAAEAGAGVAVINVASPSLPTLVQEVATSDWARDVEVHGSSLLVADGSAGLTVMDIGNPDAPVVIGSLDTENLCYAVAAQADQAFLASGTAGLYVVDISDPADPVQRSNLVFPGNGVCRHVAAAGDTVYAAVGDRGLFVVDVSDPFDPVIIGSWDTPQTAYHAQPAGTNIWVADQSGGVFAFELNPTALDEDNNRAQSLTLIGPDEPVTRARLNAVTTDSVRFELTADGGATWHHIQPGEEWIEFPEPGEEFRWRATLTDTDDPDVPSCYQIDLEFEQLFGYGTITGVTDVPGDTGGQVRLAWTASRFDVPDEEHTVTEYSIYRRFDEDPLKGGDLSLAYPPGSWDYLTSVPADMEGEYALVVPTLADSTVTQGMAWSVYFVRARTSTPGTFFDSPPDSGYSVNNLQPAPPTGFFIHYGSPEGTRLSWDPPSLPDFAHFRIYRTADPEIPPQPGTLFQVTTETSYLDTEPGTWFYDLTVVNLAGQESEPADHYSASGESLPGVQLHPAVPNPFNPRTILSFTVPAGGARVQLSIFDARGRLVRTLADGPFPAGLQQVTWDGTNQQGRPVGSGVYQGRIRSGSLSRVVKMLLVR